MKRFGIHGMVLALVVVATIFICLRAAAPAAAGGYSDYSANKSSGSTSSNLALKYGGTYSQAGQNNMNYRYGYGSGSNSNYYSPQQSSPSLGTRQKPITVEQRREMNRLIKQSDDLVNRINNDPMLK